MVMPLDCCEVQLVETLLDGQGRPQLFTQAATVYACPAAAIVNWQADRGRAILPGTWAPPHIVSKEFIVFLSSAEGKKGTVKLKPTVERAYELLSKTGLAAPAFESAPRIIASEERLLDAVQALCHARVVVFDATDFEPAIMLLAGIRAVVRRGVTILSVGGSYTLGKPLDIPFNVTDANVVAHSKDQDRSGVKNSVKLLADRIRGGLDEVQSPYYLDLPVYDALRRLPPDRRGIIPSEEGVLVLCSFDKDYLRDVWREKLKDGLQHQRERLPRDTAVAANELGVARSLDITSARVVSQALFETIRRAQSCVADLTNWPSNVLFELGVRLAASSERTACLLRSGWEATVNPVWLEQCRNLVLLLVPSDHHYDAERDWGEEKAFEKVYGPQAVKGKGVLGGSVYSAVERGLDIRSEHAARPVYQELLDSAELFSRPPGKGGRSKPVGLYPGHPELPGKEEEAEFERLLAAWFYLNHRYEGKTTGPTSSGAAATVVIAQNIYERHSLRLQELPKVEEEIKRVAGIAATTVPVPKTLEEIRGIKRTAIALRNQGEFQRSLDLLDVALAALEKMSSEAGLDAAQVIEIRVERADTFGMKGGVYRRQNRLHEAYRQYEDGLKFEEVDRQSTYNLSNVIALGVTEEGISPRDPKMRQSIEAAITLLVSKTSGTRTDEWWAWSDLGQLYLLSGDADRASAAYERARRTGPSAEEYERHIVTLKRLLEVTSQTAKDVAAAIEKVLPALSSDAPAHKSAGA